LKFELLREKRKNMKHYFTCYIIILFNFSITPLHAQGKDILPVNQHGQLKVSGNALIDKDGSPVQLRGISLSWSIWGGKKYYQPQVVNWLVKDFNVNLLRVSMAVEPDSGYLQFPEEQMALVMVVIDEAIEQGIYVLIDWHDHHADRNVEKAKVFFSHMAKRYGTCPNVLYELWNEPEEVEWKVIKKYAEEVIPVIREFDRKNVIVIGSPRWDQDVDVAALDPLTGFDQLVYSFHFYASDPNHQQMLRQKADCAMDAGLPLIVTEWGVGEANGDGVFDQQKTNAWLEWMEKHRISWANWNLTDKEETTALLKPGAAATGGWGERELTPAGQYIRTQLRKLNSSK
jgi:endoglucanase